MFKHKVSLWLKRFEWFMHKLPWSNRRKISDVMTGHFNYSHNAWEPFIQSLDDCNYNVTETDDYRKLFLLLALAHGLKRYPEDFRKLGLGPVVRIWQVFRSPLLSIETQLLMLIHAGHFRGKQHSFACCNLLVLRLIDI